MGTDQGALVPKFNSQVEYPYWLILLMMNTVYGYFIVTLGKGDEYRQEFLLVLARKCQN
jgi:hypothetical protein